MPEVEQVFSSKVKVNGILSFEDFYKFCYDYLSQELSFDVIEKAYKEKIMGDAKKIEIEWGGFREMTDYFKFTIKVEFQVLGLTKIEVNKDGKKLKMNKGSVEIRMKGYLLRDWKGKFESSSTQKFVRSIYEKWIIPSRIEALENKLIGDLDEFLSQAKAFLDLEAKRGPQKFEHYTP